MKKISAWIKLLRIKQWVKNGIVFFPMFFGKEFNSTIIMQSFIAFLSFSCLASAVYIINDISDVEKDRCHPKKCKRPIANGEIIISQGLFGHVILFLFGFLLLFCIKISYHPIYGMFLYIGYYILNIFYTLRGKNIPLLDVVILSSGFLIRLFFGSAITGIIISEWLYLVIMAGSFYLGLSKRRNELKCKKELGIEKTSRAVLDYYNYEFLDKNMYVCFALTIAFYSLWCAEHPEKGSYLLSTVPIVLTIAMKYSLNSEKEGTDGDPTDSILNDKIMILLILLLVIMLFVILYIL